MAAAAGFTRIVQQDLSGGMFPSLAPELIPPNGAYDITNGLLSEQDVVFRRGGTSYLSTLAEGEVRMLWAGYLKHGGLQTILATSSGTFRVNADGSLTTLPFATPDVLCQGVAFQGVLYMPGGVTFDGESAGTDGRPGGATPATAYAVAGNRLIAGAGSRVSVSHVPKSEGEAVAWSEETDFLQLPEGVSVTGMASYRTSVVVFTTRGIYVIGGLSHASITDEAGNVQWSQDLYSADAALWGAPGVTGWKGGLVVPCRDDVWLMELGVSSEKAVAFRNISHAIQVVYRRYVAAGYTPGAAAVFNGHYFLPVMAGQRVVDLLVCRLEGFDAAGKADVAWTHLKGYGAELAALVSTQTDLEGPLIGAIAQGAKVLRLGYLEPGGEQADANREPIGFSITTRSIPTGNLTANLVAKARLSYELTEGVSGIEESFGGTEWGAFNWGEGVWGEEGSSELTVADAPALKLAVGSTSVAGSVWGGFDWGEGDWSSPTGTPEELEGQAPPDPEALRPYVWRVGRKVRYCRMTISLSGSAQSCSIRMLELFVRQDGRMI